MNLRLVLGILMVAGTMAVGGCSSEPAPVASVPAFATEEEAFAAAEQTYRNYVDALNQIDLSDPATFEEVYRWTTGDANAEARRSFSQMHADGWTVSGESVASTVEVSLADDDAGRPVSLAICLDVSAVEVVDSQGESTVSGDRGPVQSMTIHTATSAESPTRLLVSSIEGREGEPTCAPSPR